MTRALVRRRGKVLWQCEPADTFLKRLRGLMFRKAFGRPLLFIFKREGRHAIHSIFCFVDFDAIFLNSRGTVVSLFEKIKPFTLLIRPRNGAKYLIEAPVGSIKRGRLHIGSRLKVVA